MTLPHLSDEQVADYLSGISRPATASHLAQCAECREEIDRVSVSIHSFNQASMAWSERATRLGSERATRLGSERATSARGQAQAAVAAKLRSARAWYGIVGIACALIVACALLLATFHRHANVSEVVKGKAPYISDGTAEIDSDNQLLGAIDREQDSTSLSPEKMYGGQVPAITLTPAARID